MTGIMCVTVGNGLSGIVNFVDHTIYSSVVTGTAVSQYQVNSNGSDYEFENGISTLLTQWVTPTAVAGNYEIYATATLGTVTAGVVGSWVATSGSPSWTVSKGGPTSGINTAILSMQIRAVGSTTVLDTWQITLTAEK